MECIPYTLHILIFPWNMIMIQCLFALVTIDKTKSLLSTSCLPIIWYKSSHFLLSKSLIYQQIFWYIQFLYVPAIFSSCGNFTASSPLLTDFLEAILCQHCICFFLALLYFRALGLGWFLSVSHCFYIISSLVSMTIFY